MVPIPVIGDREPLSRGTYPVCGWSVSNWRESLHIWCSVSISKIHVGCGGVPVVCREVVEIVPSGDSDSAVVCREGVEIVPSGDSDLAVS
jgi:hypothetical protein